MLYISTAPLIRVSYHIVTGGSPEELQQDLQYLSCPQDSPASIQQEIEYLRLQLEGERELLQQHLHSLVQQNYNLAESTREQLDL